MEVDKTQLAISRAARAKALLDDDLLAGAFKTLEQSYIDAWRATAVVQSDARERLWQGVQIVGLVRDQLGHVVSNGKIAQAELDKLAALEKKKQ
jgi:hypothetical protein